MKKILLPHQLYYPYVDVIKDKVTQKKEVEFKIKLNRKSKNKNAMIYIHVPYCNSKCTFCGFYKINNLDSSARYISQLKKEVDYYCSKTYVKGLKITGIHIGGGTPTYLPTKLLGEIIDYVKYKFNADKTPLNIEASACTINKNVIKFLKQKKVNRVSIGVQSFDSTLREKLEIKSTLKETLKVIPLLKKNGLTVYIDLMYGFPYMNGIKDYKKIVENDIRKTIELGVDGLDFSQYYPYFNPLGKLIDIEKLKFPSKAEVIEVIKLAARRLEKAGYIQTTEYGFCKSGEIMLEKTYFGDELIDCIALGPRSLGYLNGFKYMNGSYIEKEVPTYILLKKLSNSELERIPIVTFPKLLKIDKKIISKKLHCEFDQKFKKLINEKLLVETSNYYELTEKGKYYISNVYLSLMNDSEIKRIKDQTPILELK